MKKINKKTILVCFFLGIIFLIFPNFSQAACDCGSTDSANPCTGQSISVTVTAGTPNGGVAVNNIYNWSFNSGGGDAFCGQFANGDYWVAPAAGQTEVAVTGITSNGNVSADLNPRLESMGLLDGSKNYGNYSASENIIPILPQSYSGINSIVAAIKRNEALEGNCGTAAIVGECADSYNVLTVLNSVPENAGSTVIRPNITGETKELLTFSDFDFSRLPSYDFLTGLDATGYETIRRRWSHSTEIFGLGSSLNGNSGYSEGGRAFRAHTQIDDYGGGVAVAWNNNMMNLFSDSNALEEKMPAISAMLAYGLDIYHSIYDSPLETSRTWLTGATQHPGKLLPPVFLSALAKNRSYADNLKTVSQHVHDPGKMGPPELAQVVTGKTDYLWGDIPSLSGIYFQGSYWANLFASQCYDGALGVCNPSLGSKTMFDPYGYIDGPPNKPGTSYIGSSLGIQKAFVAIMILMPEIREIVNYPQLITYVDRILNEGIKTADDPCVTPDSRENLETCDAYRNTGCLYYGVTWGPINVIDVTSDCITTPTHPYNKAGRFTELDGTHIGMTYTSGQVESNWNTIRALYDGASPNNPSGLNVL
ncbi:MAG: hypothetical protein RBR98_01755 [Candidatus Moranbacteria bacterium]|jgi:hypothetical protein|nr:hypothetical protein [Candidatus Moranbacteria bacterium]